MVGVSGVTYALVTITRPVTISGHIVSSPGVQIYTAFACETPWESWTPGDLKKGESETATAYVKNTGDTPIDITWSCDPGGSGVAITATRTGALTDWAQNTVVTLNAGQIMQFNPRVTIGATATPDSNYSFTLNLVGTH